MATATRRRLASMREMALDPGSVQQFITGLDWAGHEAAFEGDAGFMRQLARVATERRPSTGYLPGSDPSMPPPLTIGELSEEDIEEAIEELRAYWAPGFELAGRDGDRLHDRIDEHFRSRREGAAEREAQALAAQRERLEASERATRDAQERAAANEAALWGGS